MRSAAVFLGAMAASLLPRRTWPRLPASFVMGPAAFCSAVATFFLGAAIGIPGFLAHAAATASLANAAQVEEAMRNPHAGYSQGLSMGFAGLSIFTFLLLTPKGWATLYLMIGGAVRMSAAWFDDAMGDPMLTGADAIVLRVRARRHDRAAAASREALEGPEIRDRVVSPAAAGIAGCDLVIVAARPKPGWERGVAVFTAEKTYRLGEPVEQTVAGRLRHLYPLTEHTDFEAIRRSVQYELPRS